MQCFQEYNVSSRWSWIPTGSSSLLFGNYHDSLVIKWNGFSLLDWLLYVICHNRHCAQFFAPDWKRVDLGSLPNTKRRNKWAHIWSWFAGMRNMWDMQGYMKNQPKSLWEVNDTLQTECKNNISFKAQWGPHTMEWPRLICEILESSRLSILFPLNIFSNADSNKFCIIIKSALPTSLHTDGYIV